MKKVVFVILFFFIFLISCDSTSFDVYTEEIVIGVGEEYELVNGFDYYINTSSQITLSSNSSIIEISSNTITGISSGECVLELTYQDITFSINVLVINKTRKLDLDIKNKLNLNSEIEFIIKVDDDSFCEFVITLSDEKVLKIEDNILKAIGIGECCIYVYEVYSGLFTNKIVTVVDNSDLSIAQVIMDYALNRVGTSGFDSVNLPKKHPDYESSISFSSSDEALFCPITGLLEFCDFDEVVLVTCTVTYNEITISETFEFTILSTILETVKNKFLTSFKADKVFNDLNIQTELSTYGGTYITWYTSNEEILNSFGEYNKPFYDTVITIYFNIKTTSPALERSFEHNVTCMSMSNAERSQVISAYLDEVIGTSLEKTTHLPTYLDEFKVNLQWLNVSGGKLDLNFDVSNPIINDTYVYVDIVVNLGTSKFTINKKYDIVVDVYDSIWDLIDLYVNTISKTPLTTYTYLLVSWQSTNLGYIPFMTNTVSERVVDIIPITYKKVRTGIIKSSTEYIVIHDTGNPNVGADGKAHARVMENYNNNPDNTSISWHMAIDDERTYVHLPLDEVAYHAGDGSHVFGDVYHNTSYGKTDCIGGGNRNGIGIESCIDKGSDYTQTMRNMAKVVSELLIEYDLGFDRIKQHYNFSGKNCPQVMRENNRWNEFLYLVRLEYFLKTALSEVELVWTSYSTDLNNNGQITKELPIGSIVNYGVKATYKGEVREYTFSSTLVNRS